MFSLIVSIDCCCSECLQLHLHQLAWPRPPPCHLRCGRSGQANAAYNGKPVAGRHAKGRLRPRRAQQAPTHLDLCGPHAQSLWKSPGVGPPQRTSQAFPRQAQGHTCPPTPQGRAPGHPPVPCRNGKLWHPGVCSACRAKRPSPPFPRVTAKAPALGLGGKIGSTCSPGLLGLYVCRRKASACAQWF